MELIAARIRHDIHDTARLRAVVRRKRTGFDFEFPQGVGKGKRQTDIRDRVHVDTAVEDEQCLPALTTGNREC